jgi:hypothetical protein
MSKKARSSPRTPKSLRDKMEAVLEKWGKSCHNPLDTRDGSNHPNDIMKTKEVKAAQTGNPKGVRHPKASADRKLSWEDTAREMAKSQEDWLVSDNTAGDGLDGVAWTPQRSQ